MECARKYYCRLCYDSGELDMLSGPVLDVYMLICHAQGLKDDATEILACFRCQNFLKEVHCFRDEDHGDGPENLAVKPPEVDLILSCAIDENSAKMVIKTEVVDENVEMNQIDIQITKVEVDSDPENLQQISETSLESLFVSNVEKNETEAHHSLNINENTLSMELGAIPNIETSKCISKPLNRSGRGGKKNRYRLLKCNECSFETTITGSLNQHIIHKHSDEKPFSCDKCDYRSKYKSSLTTHMKIHLINRDRPYKCNQCSHATTTATNLEFHIKTRHSDEKPFFCDHCDYNCKMKYNIRNHMKKHFQKPKPCMTFKCKECSFTTTSADNLRRHIRRKYRKESQISSITGLHIRRNEHFPKECMPFKCNECSFTTTTADNLRRHIRRKYGKERQLSCDHCNYNCKTKFSLRNHMKKHFPKQCMTFKCNECSYTTTTAVNLKRHIRLRHGKERLFSCDHCNYNCITKDSLQIHMNRHFPKDLKCKDCTYEGKNFSNLKSHIAHKHSDERPFSCDQCESSFKTKSDLSQHQKVHSTKRDKPFKCNECSFATVKPGRLNQHILFKHEKTHMGHLDKNEMEVHNSINLNENNLLIELKAIPNIETSKCSISRPLKRPGRVCEKNRYRLLKCNECSYETTSGRLKQHIIYKHSDEKPFSCDQCDYRSKLKSNLNTHMKIHLVNRDRPYKCNQCSHATTTATNLEFHIRTRHSDDKPFFCDHCNYNCKMKYNLRHHMKNHFPKCDRLFKCNECSYEVTTASLLKRHVSYKHTEERRFSCDNCDARFRNKKNVYLHMKIHLMEHERLFKCNECSYTTTNLLYLERHNRRTHLKGRLFSCDRCNYNCMTKYNLEIHMNRHIPKNFKCKECSYEGKNFSYLKSHIAHKHSDKRPFSCDQCESRFKTKSDVSQHKKIHSTIRDKPFKCNECSFATVKPGRLSQHILLKHEKAQSKHLEKSETDVHNSLNPNENSLLIELKSVPYIETSERIRRPLKRPGSVCKKTR